MPHEIAAQLPASAGESASDLASARAHACGRESSALICRHLHWINSRSVVTKEEPHRLLSELLDEAQSGDPDPIMFVAAGACEALARSGVIRESAATKWLADISDAAIANRRVRNDGEGERVTNSPVATCSFCGGGDRKGVALLHGPSVAICRHCVEHMVSVLRQSA